MPEIYYSIITHRPIADWRVPHSARYPWKEMGIDWASGYSDFSGMGGCTVFWILDDLLGEVCGGGSGSPGEFRNAVTAHHAEMWSLAVSDSPYLSSCIQLIGWNNEAFDNRVIRAFGGSINYPTFSIYNEIKHLKSDNYTEPPPSSAPWGSTVPLPPKSNKEKKRGISKQHPWSLNGLCRTAIASLSRLESIPAQVPAGSWMVGSGVDAATLKASGNSGTANAIGWGRTWMIRGLWKARDRIVAGRGTIDLTENQKIIRAIMYLKREAGNVPGGYALLDELGKLPPELFPDNLSVAGEDEESPLEGTGENPANPNANYDIEIHWEQVFDKPDFYTTKWEKVQQKPDKYNSDWDLITNIPRWITNIENTAGFESKVKQIIGDKEESIHWSDIVGIPSYIDDLANHSGDAISVSWSDITDKPEILTTSDIQGIVRDAIAELPEIPESEEKVIHWDDIEGKPEIPEVIDLSQFEADLETVKSGLSDVEGEIADIKSALDSEEDENSGKELLPPEGDGGITWNDITDKPETFPSTWDDISGKSDVEAKLSAFDEIISRGFNWDDISGKPDSFPSAVPDVQGLQKFVNDSISDATQFLSSESSLAQMAIQSLRERVETLEETVGTLETQVNNAVNDIDDMMRAINSLNIFAWQINQAKVIDRLDEIEQILNPDQP